MATLTNLSLQNSNSPLMEQLIFFYDHSMIILTIITLFVSYLMFLLFFNLFTNQKFLSNQFIEIIWTILPAIILLFIAFPSLKILYLMDEINKPLLSFKTIGHQWYWSYEYFNINNIEFDSYLINSNSVNNFRLLDVDNKMVMPVKTLIRIIISAMDVLHSWTIPTLGVKVDAVPGRLNQTNFFLNRKGLFFGQCSEICGANHSFMPIIMEGTNFNFFFKWLIKMNS